MSKTPTVSDLAEQVHQLRAEVAAMRIELAAHEGVAARVVEMYDDPTLAGPRKRRAEQVELARIAAERAATAATARAAKEKSEQSDRDRRLAAHAALIETAQWVRVSTRHSSWFLGRGNIDRHHPADYPIRKWRGVAEEGGIRESIADGDIEVTALPADWAEMGEDARRRYDNEWRLERLTPAERAKWSR